MKNIFIILCLSGLVIYNYAQIVPHKGPSVNFSHGRLVVSANHRFLNFEDGTPFFYLGDTGWELFHRLTFKEAEKYLENRRQKGFTVIQAVILAELDGLNTPDRNGNKPLIGNNPLKPDESYFAFVDSVIRLAGTKGIFIGLLPTWGDKVDPSTWGAGPLIFNPENALAYGKYLGERYRDFPNIIWITGGDRSGGTNSAGTGNNFPVWDALGKGLRSADSNHLITFHPGGEKSSSEWFHNCDWLDFNMAQTGHGQRSYDIYRILIRSDYERIPVKPCMDGEARYEDHPINWRPDSLGWFNEMHVRQAAYWDLFTGSLGHTYGCHPIWQMASPGKETVGYARHYWYEVLDLPGAWQMLNVRRLMESRPMLDRVPFQDIVLNTDDEYGFIAATRGPGYIMVYTALGNDIELNGDLLPAENYKTWWYDPRSGKSLQAAQIEKKPVLKFSAPSRGPGFDWVLVLDEESRSFVPPGSVIQLPMP